MHLYFLLCENMICCVRVHGLLDIATVTKEGGFLRMVNCVMKSQNYLYSLLRGWEKKELRDVNSELQEKNSHSEFISQIWLLRTVQ